MKIIPVSQKQTSDFRFISKENKKHDSVLLNSYSNLRMSYPKEFYLNFTGGKSLSLKDTIAQLEKFECNIPAEVKKRAIKTINEGNKENKRLIDIHKEYYKELFDCDNLEEIKFFFPEFKDVKSLEDIEKTPNKSSVIDKFLNGEIKTKDGKLLLNPEKDLTVQLIQMYWGDCLSLNDIKNETGCNFYHTMEKLNIPRANSLYGHYLKLSDEEANRAITQAMQRNRTIPEKKLKKQGKPLSDETKSRISDSLKKYYETHEHVKFYQTEEDEEYFGENPYQSEIFSQVLLRAWKYQEARSIKKALSKHFKKQEKDIDETILRNTQQSKALKEFWNKNVWAKKQWSICMSKSWERQRALKEIGLIYEPLARFPILKGDLLSTSLMIYLALENAPNNDNPYVKHRIKSALDIFDIAIPDKREPLQRNERYKCDKLIALIKEYGSVIIDKGYGSDIASIPFYFAQILSHIVKKNSLKGEYSPLIQSKLSTLNSIISKIDKKAYKNYNEEKTPENLMRAFEVYANMIADIWEANSPELTVLMLIFRDIANLPTDVFNKKLTDAVNEFERGYFRIS